jgi:hypothetical protein
MNRWKDSKEIRGMLVIYTFWTVIGCRMLSTRSRFTSVSVTIEESTLLKLREDIVNETVQESLMVQLRQLTCL